MTGTWRCRGGSLPESLAIGVAAFFVFRWYRQASLHGHDVLWLLRGLDQPGAVHAMHPGYFACIRVLAHLTTVTGFELLCLASALGAACFAALVHRAAVIAAPGDPMQARFVAATAVLSPACVHFATVAEVHAVFLGWFGLAWWFFARAMAVPLAGNWRGWLAAAGIAAGWAAVVHATGLLLALLLPAWLLVEHGERSHRDRLLGAMLLGCCMAATWAIGFYGLRSMGTVADDDPARFFLVFLREGNPVAVLGRTIVDEWLAPFLVGSAVVVGGFFRRDLRRRTSVLHALVAVYLLATAILLRGQVVERGAYVLPLLLPLGALLTEAVPRRAWLAIVLATGGAAIWQWHHPERGPAEVALGRAAAAFAAERPTRFLLGDLTENDGVIVVDHHLACVVGRVELERIKSLVQPDTEGLVAWLLALRATARQEGRLLLVTDGAVQLFGAKLDNFAAAWREVTAGVATERIERGALRGTGFPP